MTTAHDQHRALVEKALRQAADECCEAGPDAWRIALLNGASLRGEAAVSDADWLCLEVGLPAKAANGLDAPSRAWDLVRAGAGIGCGKLVRRNSGVGLRAELPLDAERHLVEWLSATCAGFRTAAAKGLPFCSESEERKAAPRLSLEEGEEASAIGTLIRDAGWELTERRDGSVRVPLDVTDGFYQATVEGDGQGVILAVDLLACDELVPLCRRALGELLLRCNRAVRMVRAAAREGERGVVVGLETDPVPISAPLLEHALSALSVGCRLCGKEVNALESEPVAREFLAVADAPAGPT